MLCLWNLVNISELEHISVWTGPISSVWHHAFYHIGKHRSRWRTKPAMKWFSRTFQREILSQCPKLLSYHEAHCLWKLLTYPQSGLLFLLPVWVRIPLYCAQWLLPALTLGTAQNQADLFLTQIVSGIGDHFRGFFFRVLWSLSFFEALISFFWPIFEFFDPFFSSLERIHLCSS